MSKIKETANKLRSWLLHFDYEVAYVVYNEKKGRFVLSYDSKSEGAKDVTLNAMYYTMDSTILDAKYLIEQEFERDEEELARNSSNDS